ncbi:plant intracellular Ras-group-related LRR protein 5-like isoform X2 [Cephus cinctus]|nr:plant intracellular Ras-group-related LRR protein 5-like isoform X2 [Cephus cinctus]XP_015604472.1 plant intracellular Ras-group-related LRR protein 5-like isoform X2 [Cephus cinctus]
MAKEVKQKLILHWNYRGLKEIPEVVRTYGSHIEEVYLKWNQLTYLPIWIAELHNIKNLYLYGNRIHNLPEQFGAVRQLTVLDLSANQFQSVPGCIGELSNLKSLLLNDNSIKKLPAELHRLERLEVLSISGNRLVTLPEWLGSLPNLRELNVDNNLLKELPNRLTLASELSSISVCSNRLRYLPLNGFLSNPIIRFDSNNCLNYLSYIVLCQMIIAVPRPRNVGNVLAYGCFNIHKEGNLSHNNIKLIISAHTANEELIKIPIELPRQLLKVYTVHENRTVSLWELALRKIYNSRYRHTVEIFVSPLKVKVSHQLVRKRKLSQHLPDDYVPYNLIENGPISICTNPHCQEPIFTEAWVTVGMGRYVYSIPTVALCCSRSCASKYVAFSGGIMNLLWHIADD